MHFFTFWDCIYTFPIDFSVFLLRKNGVVFATMVRSNRRAQRKIYEDLIGKHDYPFLNTCVSASSAVDDALIMYKPMLKHHSKNAVANDYMELAYEILSASVGGGCNG